MALAVFVVVIALADVVLSLLDIGEYNVFASVIRMPMMLFCCTLMLAAIIFKLTDLIKAMQAQTKVLSWISARTPVQAKKSGVDTAQIDRELDFELAGAKPTAKNADGGEELPEIDPDDLDKFS